MTLTDDLTDDLHDTAAALRSGWPIENLNRARRARAEEQRTMSDIGDMKDLIERATPILRELRRACSGRALFDACDDDMASALASHDPESIIDDMGDGEWCVSTPEFRVFSRTKPERAK